MTMRSRVPSPTAVSAPIRCLAAPIGLRPAPRSEGSKIATDGHVADRRLHGSKCRAARAAGRLHPVDSRHAHRDELNPPPHSTANERPCPQRLVETWPRISPHVGVTVPLDRKI